MAAVYIVNRISLEIKKRIFPKVTKVLVGIFETEKTRTKYVVFRETIHFDSNSTVGDNRQLRHRTLSDFMWSDFVFSG